MSLKKTLFVITGMMLSPMLRLKGALAALLLVSVTGKKSASFLKAIEQPAHLRNNEKARQNLINNLVAKAQPRRLEENVEEEVDYGEFGFDVTAYSVKYTGCSAILTYSDEAAQEADTVLETKRFVVFRLCPTDSCNKYDAKGCSSNYGEYVLEMGDYLETMAQYNEEKLEKYCEYCNQCAEAQGQAAEEEQAGEDEQGAEEDQADEEDQAAEEDGNERKRRLEDQAAADDEAADEAAADDQAAGDDATDACTSVCSDYATLCDVEGEDEGEAEDEYEAADFFECVQFQNENDGSVYYLGPHCSDDVFSIVIGVYSDEDCNTYVGSEISVYDATGIDLSGLDLSAYYPHDCQSCKEGQYEYDNNEDDNGDEDEVMEFCENLYMSSAKCNTNFETVNAEAYYSAQQVANEEQVCNFIANIVSGKYDESGDIIIDVYKYNASDWKNTNQYVNAYNAAKKDVSGGQVAGLVLSILGCFFLCIYACILHASLKKKGLQWKPRRGKYTDPTAISRQNSGIVMGRSRSGPNGPLV